MDFSFNIQQTPSTNTSTNRPTTERQVSFYKDLCAQRNTEPVDVTNMTFQEVASLIEELKTFYPASESQINLVKTKITNLQSMNVKINMPDTSKLTGGRNGSASKLIENLIEMEKIHADTAPPSDAQLSFMVSMYLCPDVDFEAHQINRRIELNGNLWRKYTPEEFASLIKKSMTRKEASAFIDKNRGSFHNWKQTRIKIEQQSYIRTLEARMADMSTPGIVEWSVDQSGNLVQVQKPRKKEDTTVSGYTPLDDMELLMFSSDEASKYIDMLKSELERKELYKFGERSDGSESFEELRIPKNANEVKKADYEELQNLMYKLEAIAGYNDEDLHEAVTYLLVEENCDEACKENKAKIQGFMQELIEQGCIDIDGLIELTKDCPPAQKILIGM